MRVWITRARPGADRTARAVADLGHDPVVAPLIEIRRLTPAVPAATALAFTSVNAVAAFAALTPDRSSRVLAVGDATAEAARQAGFVDVRSAAGDGRALAEMIASEGADALLWPCATQVAFDLTQALIGRVAVARLPVYEATPVSPPPAPDADVVLIHSALAARLLAEALSPDRARPLTALAMSAAAAAPLAALPFAAVTVAAHPDDDSLLAPLGKPPSAV